MRLRSEPAGRIESTALPSERQSACVIALHRIFHDNVLRRAPCGFLAFTREATHFAKELVALQSDGILTQGTPGTAALKRKCSARTAKVWSLVLRL